MLCTNRIVLNILCLLFIIFLKQKKTNFNFSIKKFSIKSNNVHLMKHFQKINIATLHIDLK